MVLHGDRNWVMLHTRLFCEGLAECGSLMGIFGRKSQDFGIRETTKTIREKGSVNNVGTWVLSAFKSGPLANQPQL